MTICLQAINATTITTTTAIVTVVVLASVRYNTRYIANTVLVVAVGIVHGLVVVLCIVDLGLCCCFAVGQELK